MNKMKFNSVKACGAWHAGIANPTMIVDTPIIINDGWRINLDMSVKCKSWKTALRRFERMFAEDYENLHGWIEGMRDSAEHGVFFRCDDGSSMNNLFAWGIEKAEDEDRFYVYLNVTGAYR